MKRYESWYAKVSFSVALLMLFAMCVFFIVSMIVVCSNSENKRLKVTKLKFGFLLNPFKDSKLYTTFWILYMTKVTVYAFLQAIITEYATGPMVI